MHVVLLGKRIHACNLRVATAGYFFFFTKMVDVCGVTDMVGMVGGGVWQVRDGTDFPKVASFGFSFDDLAFEIVATAHSMAGT